MTLPGGETLGARGEQTLADLATVVATAAAVTRAAAEVDEARARLARARLEERRVIRREIHDGLGPSLAGLRLGLQGARNLMASDPAPAAELLATLQAELDQRVADVRSLSHSLLPPVLDELGLAAALAELAARHAEDGVEVSLDLHHDDALDPQTAAAAYGIASEAVTNTVRHSGTRALHGRTATTTGTACVVTRHRRRAAASPRTPGSGVGTRSMRERAEEQGGVLDIRSAPGGRHDVEALLPRGGGAPVSEPIRVAVVDDHPVFRLGMAGLLDSLPGITVVGQAEDAAAALALPLAEIDVVLMDLHLGEDSGIETTREIVRRDPVPACSS